MPYSQNHEIRGYHFPASCKHARYINTTSTRYSLDLGFDIPDLRTVFPDGVVESRTVTMKVADNQHTRNIRYAVYFTRYPLVVPLNSSLSALKVPVSWRGDVVVYRCSKSKKVDKLVNMHAKDAGIARRVVAQYVLIHKFPNQLL